MAGKKKTSTSSHKQSHGPVVLSTLHPSLQKQLCDAAHQLGVKVEVLLAQGWTTAAPNRVEKHMATPPPWLLDARAGRKPSAKKAGTTKSVGEKAGEKVSQPVQSVAEHQAMLRRFRRISAHFQSLLARDIHQGLYAGEVEIRQAKENYLTEAYRLAHQLSDDLVRRRYPKPRLSPQRDRRAGVWRNTNLSRK